MKVPFLDLKKQYENIKPEVDDSIARIINNTAFIGGEEVEKFERNFANLFGAKHCISVANGTDAIFIALKMAGIGAGDEVITVSNSWISTSETISMTGARVVFVDTDEYHTMDPAKIESAITEKTRAIVPVHLYGQSCDMDAILSLAKKHDIQVIEDCAQAHLTTFKNQVVGNIGRAGTFSFYPGKNLGAYGDAGAIITNDDEYAVKCKMFSNHGSLTKHRHTMEGMNSRMDGLQAAVLNVKIKYLQEWTAHRRMNAKLYDDLLSGIEQIECPKIRPESEHSFHLYVIKAQNRDDLKEYLASNGIQTSLHYPRILPLLPAYAHLNLSSHDFPNSYSQQKKILSIPMFPELEKEQIEYVSKKIQDFYRLND